MYKVTFIKQIHSCFAAVSGIDVWLELETELPFVPCAGISYQIGDIFITWHDPNIRRCEEDQTLSIVWKADLQSFAIYTQADEQLYFDRTPYSDAERKVKLEEIVEEYLQEGWKRNR